MNIWLVICKHLIPESIALLILCWIDIDYPSPILLLTYAVLLRIVWNIAIITHGLGHVLITAIVDRDPTFINRANLLEHRTIADIFSSLIPFTPIFSPLSADADYPWVAVGKTTPLAIRIKAGGGILFNIMAVGLVSIVPMPDDLFRIDLNLCESIDRLVIQAFISANALAIFSSRSDLVAMVTGEATCFNCGNFGFVGKRLTNDDRELLPARVVAIFQAMGHETEIRGEQAGGGVVFAHDPTDRVVFVGKKIINRKRQNLTRSLETAFAPVRERSRRSGAKAVDNAIVGVWHYRYATSSPPAIVETHWHEWMPARSADVWRVEQGQWVKDRQTVNHRITHNGDFDAWMLFGEEVANTELGLWLERVLHTPNSTVGDSPKIAGMMDLLITQGMWAASLRLAYQLAVAKSLSAAFGGKIPTKTAPNTAPSELELSGWAEIVEGIFCHHQAVLLLPDAQSMLELSQSHVARLEREMIQALSQHHTIGCWTELARAAFVKTAVNAFFYNNPYQAAKLFMSRATGTFGLVTASTLCADSVVLSAWGQPIATGFNVAEEYMVYASEPAAVDAVLAQIPRSYRLDLEQKGGEIAWVGVDRIAIYDIQADRELVGAELAQRWIPLQHNDYILPPAASAPDPVAHDIGEIPQVIKAIAASWQDSASFNRQSADYLAELLIEKARLWDRRQQATSNGKLDSLVDGTLDLLITGVENSLWLGERFAQDLKSICPGLKVEILSANHILWKLQSDSDSLDLGKNSIVLAISQSGQTFPTLQATQIFEQLRRQNAIGELFVMTGEVCSLMGSAIEQYYYPAASFTRRIFINGSGRRTAEPTTVAVVAAQTTLTELLLYLTKRLQQGFPARQKAFGMTLTTTNLKTLEQVRDDFVDRRVGSIVGTIESATHRQLVRVGRQWALHITEMPIAWGIQAVYVLVSVGLQAPLVQTICRAIFGLANLAVPGWLLPMLTLVDIAIYIFGSWLWTLGLRYAQGRSLFARMGKRTLVIGDVPWVHQLLTAYVSKLFSLSYGITSLDVHGANPQDQMLHLFGHRIVRGTLVFLGIPDGRGDRSQQERESAAMMTGKQANGVRHLTAGAEIIALGQNQSIEQQGFAEAIILPDAATDLASNTKLLAELREARFGALERLVASYVFFWALSKRVASFPLLRYQHWKSQSRARIMTTAAPVARVTTTSASDAAKIFDRSKILNGFGRHK
ncbi:hypothetical protein [Chamaesiphon sp. OTE_8_metabat_110]|uniref:hypothetical protein n=1 Tax=Chamaesiphon sp. OTE_8_metabat_110 TaxID=2964696 RepID=UPI00286BEAE9|nr:hypothetical protein [Chamaesiphon sp. OTE_8_metabat_110]